MTYTFASTARIYYRGGEVDLAALANGDRVLLTLHGSAILSVRDFGPGR